MKRVRYFLLMIGLALILSVHQADDKLVKKALDIHDRVFTVDTHVDTPYKLLEPGFDITKVNDIDKGGGGLEDCMDASALRNITIELVKRGYTEAEIRKIWGGNMMRIMTKAQEFAD